MGTSWQLSVAFFNAECNSLRSFEFFKYVNTGSFLTPKSPKPGSGIIDEMERVVFLERKNKYIKYYLQN